jgi:hypothetical protein
MAPKVATESIRLKYELLKETMRMSLKKMLLPLYALGKDIADQHIKYRMLDLEDHLNCLFTASDSRKKQWKRVDDQEAMRGTKLSSRAGHHSH